MHQLRRSPAVQLTLARPALQADADPHAKRRTRVLVVERSRASAEHVRLALTPAGFDVAVAGDAGRARDLVATLRPDLIILDVTVPGRPDGWALLRTLRRSGDTVPVLVVSAAATERDKVRGLRLGADDYVAKPIGTRELEARVIALLRRAEPSREARDASAQADVPPTSASVLRLGGLAIDVNGRMVRRGARRVPLTPTQFDLLLFLAERRGRVVSRAELLRSVFTRDNGAGSRTVDTHMSALRRKLGDERAQPEILHTVWGRGYRFGS